MRVVDASVYRPPPPSWGTQPPTAVARGEAVEAAEEPAGAAAVEVVAATVASEAGAPELVSGLDRLERDGTCCTAGVFKASACPGNNSDVPGLSDPCERANSASLSEV